MTDPEATAAAAWTFASFASALFAQTAAANVWAAILSPAADGFNVYSVLLVYRSCIR